MTYIQWHFNLPPDQATQMIALRKRLGMTKRQFLSEAMTDYCAKFGLELTPIDGNHRWLDDVEVREIFRLRFEHDVPQNEIAEKFNVDESAITLLLQGKRKPKITRPLLEHYGII